MSSVDPLAVIAAQVAATQSTVPDASLDLGAIAQVLQAQLSAGDVLAATILPPQGGQDLISILGQTVVAQLPADVHPGDVLLLQVTGFQGNQILVRNLGVQDLANPIPTVIPQLPPQVSAGTSSAATLTTIVGNPGVPAAPVATPQTPVPVEIPIGNGPPVAPPASVFVAASVRPAPQAAAPQQAAVPAQTAVPQQAAVPAQTAAPSQTTVPAQAAATSQPAAPSQAAVPAQPRTVASQAPASQAQPAAPADVEARLAASRAVTVDRPATQTPAAPAPAPQRTTTPPAAPDARQVAAQSRPTNLPTAPPLITRAAPHPPAAAAQSSPSTVAPAAREQEAAPHAAVSVTAQLTNALASKEPVKILAALRVPATPITLAAARVVSTATAQVQTALQNLEQVLSQTHSSDARIATLTTQTAFVSQFEPRNAQTLSAQLSAFVSNVLGGGERKLSQLLQAVLTRAAGEGAPAAATTPTAGAPSAAAASATPTAIAPAHIQIVAEARAAERQSAISQDLKSTVLSLLANPPAGSSPQLSEALNQSLTALTAMQFNTLIANQQDPSTLALSVPLMFYDGGQAANIRVSRDAPNKKSQRLDADNFHIAFVLDTQALGTVAIDLETVGRAVKVAVKTDRASAVEQFSSSLGDLRARLEHLRYTVTSTGAERVGPPAAPAPEHIASASPNVDLQA